MKITLIVAVVLSIVTAFFALQNMQHTQVTFLGWYFDGPLVIVLLITFGAGVITTFLAMLPGSMRKSRDISKLNALLAEYSSKLSALEKQQRAKESQPEKSKPPEIL
jgi:uncharacterized integral membrane protein